MKKFTSLVLALLLVLTMSFSAFAVEIPFKETKEKTLQWILNPENTGIDYANTDKLNAQADWNALNLAQNHQEVPEEYTTYIVAALPKNIEGAGATTLARVYLAVTAAGMDPTDVGGVNLIEKLNAVDYAAEKNVFNLSYALLAMNFKEEAAFQEETKQLILTNLLGGQILTEDANNGAFSWSTDSTMADMDSTAMVLQSLMFYAKNNATVKTACDAAIDYLMRNQGDDGLLVSWGMPNLEVSAQTVLVLGGLNLNPNDARFTKNGKSLLDGILACAKSDGSFTRAGEDTPNLMATNQALQAMIAAERYLNGEPSYFTQYVPTVEPETETETETEPETETTTQQEGTTQSQETVEIPKTGVAPIAAPALFAASLMGIAVLKIKKHD